MAKKIVGAGGEELARVSEVSDAPQSEERKVIAAVTIQVFEDGQLSLDIDKDGRELSYADLEALTKNVYDQLYEQRIATKALELFKARL